MNFEADLKLWKTKMAVGRMAYEAGMSRQAAQHFQRALELVDEKKLPDELLSQTLLNLAKSLGSLGRFDEAEHMLRRALQLDEQNSASDADFFVELIEDYHQLSLLYWRSGKADLAGEPLKKAFELLAQHPKVPDELTAKLLKHKAVLAEFSGDYKLCDKLINECLNFIRESHELGKDSALFGDCLMVKVMVLAELDKYDEAIELYQEAKQVLEFTRGLAHPRIAQMMEALAVLAQRKGLLSSAEELRREEAEVKELISKQRNSY